ncbi:MAG: GNAT family N-acetyltransferase [bacterium]|nr:GNAT family N-acetyltransferase [bacterium]
MLDFYLNKKVVFLEDPDEDLQARSLVHEDLNAIRGWFKDLSLVRYSFGVVNFTDSECHTAAEDYMRLVSNPHSPCYFVAVCHKDSKILGLCKYDLRSTDGVGRVALAGIMMGDPHCRSHGVGTKAMALFIRFLFEKEDVSLVEVETADYNVRAQRCFAKVGFEICDHLYSLEGALNYGFGKKDAPKILMRLDKERYLKCLAPVGGVLKEKKTHALSTFDFQAP